ncbi:molybdate ABC transporter permease subunit [Albirhodobacter sp. R86504]|uniref:molybdate ABC transporter permease subunit n=1 Tax=Albirhodobacter sp. R86504 TaxID=3093848 RepID=UPI0036735EAD
MNAALFSSQALADALGPLALSVQLGLVTTAVLLVLATPLAWWLSQTRSRLRPFIETLTALPLVLPPTVLGFYLLILFAPDAPLGGVFNALTGSTLTFSFAGLVFASCLYSLPFAVQPAQAAFEALGQAPFEAAASLGARPSARFFTVALPLAARGLLTGGVLTFAHTLGEFGVVLMVGGNIEGRTKVISIAIYEHVETIQLASAHLLSALMLALSFATLMAVYVLRRPPHRGRRSRAASAQSVALEEEGPRDA